LTAISECTTHPDARPRRPLAEIFSTPSSAALRAAAGLAAACGAPFPYGFALRAGGRDQPTDNGDDVDQTA
jgi:hypothetical protein